MSKKNQRLVILLSVIMTILLFPISSSGNDLIETETPNKISIVVDNTDEGINAIDAKFEEGISQIQVVNTLADYILLNNYKMTSRNEALRIAKAHVKSSEETGIPVWVGMAINKRESTFRKGVVSPNNTSYGLMGIHCAVWKKKFAIQKCSELFNIERNVSIGYKIIEEYSSYNCSSKNCFSSGLMRYHGYSKKTKTLAQQYTQNVMHDANKVKRIVNNAEVRHFYYASHLPKQSS